MRLAQRFTALLLTLIVLCLFPTAPIQAQDEASQPAPQFLYRDDTRLILVDGYTGEITKLPFEVTNHDRFGWSPDGRYLMARLYDDEAFTTCLNLYDVDTLDWLYDEPISCDVGDAIFSPDAAHIFYESTDRINGVLWLYTLADQTSQKLYQTPEGSELREEGISDLEWSPTEAYLTFVRFHQIMGGTINSLIIMNMDSHDYVEVFAPNSYYASYYPVWSADDRWFLVKLKDQYVSGPLPMTNHEGDVYLVNSDTGEKYRLSYTPAEYEYDLHWTAEGGIVFKTTQVITHDFTLDQAMNVPEVPAEDIVLPEPYDDENVHVYNQGVMLLFPDTDWSLGIWKTDERTPEGEYKGRLDLGLVYNGYREAYHAYPLSDSHELIGWRPSNGVYQQESPYAPG